MGCIIVSMNTQATEPRPAALTISDLAKVDPLLSSMGSSLSFFDRSLYRLLCQLSATGETRFPTNYVLSDYLGVSLRTIVRSVNKLKSTGLLSMGSARSSQGLKIRTFSVNNPPTN